MRTNFRKATISDIPIIWEIIFNAILRRKREGSNQWQDGYPNKGIIRNDIDNGVGHLIIHDEEIVGYCAILINDEPEYDHIQGKWLTNDDYVVFHRLAICNKHLGKGIAKKVFKLVEQYALEKKINSIKADTNFDNQPMLRIFGKMDYSYCGEVFFRGSPRRAFEKVLTIE
jgi:RimJ/RimL family protein N-acetyltransferase